MERPTVFVRVFSATAWFGKIRVLNNREKRYVKTKFPKLLISRHACRPLMSYFVPGSVSSYPLQTKTIRSCFSFGNEKITVFIRGSRPAVKGYTFLYFVPRFDRNANIVPRADGRGATTWNANRVWVNNARAGTWNVRRTDEQAQRGGWNMCEDADSGGVPNGVFEIIYSERLSISIRILLFFFSNYSIPCFNDEFKTRFVP